MTKKTILIVDDDVAIVKFLRANLQANQYKTLVASNGKEAIDAMERELPDLVLLDIMMPEVDGFEVCQRIREWSQVPIIMLTARGDERDKVRCLDMGADDYISKPFSVDELVARVRAVLRRSQVISAIPSKPIFSCGEMEIHFSEHKVLRNGTEIKLTPTEYNLLGELALNAGKVLTYQHLLQKIWGPEYRDEREYLHIYVNRLRAKLSPEASACIVTVPGVGYELKNK